MAEAPEVPLPTPEAWRRLVSLLHFCLIGAEQSYIRAWGTRNSAYCDGLRDGLYAAARMVGLPPLPSAQYDPSWLEDQEGAVDRWRAGVGLPPKEVDP